MSGGGGHNASSVTIPALSPDQTETLSITHYHIFTSQLLNARVTHPSDHSDDPSGLPSRASRRVSISSNCRTLKRKVFVHNN